MCAFLNFSLFCLPLADVAGAVLVLRAPGAAPDAVYVLVALGRVFGEVDSCAKKGTNWFSMAILGFWNKLSQVG